MTYLIRSSTSATVLYGIFALAAFRSLTLTRIPGEAIAGISTVRATNLLLDTILQSLELVEDLAARELVRRLLAADAVELGLECVALLAAGAALRRQRDLVLDRVLCQGAKAINFGTQGRVGAVAGTLTSLTWRASISALILFCSVS